MERNTRGIIPGHFAVDRHDITTHDLTQKLKSPRGYIVRHEVFWSVLCQIYPVQWQEMGLPDAYILLNIYTIYAQYDTWTIW